MTEKQQSWASVWLLTIGAVLVALNIPETKWAFPILSAGRIWLSYLMYKRRDWPLFASNFIFLITNIIGIIRWF